MTTLLQRLWHGVSAYAVKFGVVGLIGFGLDVLVFNLLRVGVFGHDHLAIIFTWIGNRYWTFREHRRKNFVLELGEYIVVSLGGMAIAVGCLYLSHYVLGFTSLLADNLASNVIGLGLGTLFRFFLYRFWVYGHHRADGLANLARAEEAQRTIFEEPEAEGVPTGSSPREPGTMNGPLPRGPLS
jgi:putative flippase GtrA